MMKKKITTIALLLAFAAIAITGGTLAYFTDTDDATNTFTMGNVEIVLNEAVVSKTIDNKWVIENSQNRTKSNHYYGVYPGAIVPKDPTIHNTGMNAAYVRLKVTIADSVMSHYENFDKLVNNTLHADWTYKVSSDDGNSRTYALTYQKVLNSNDSTPAAFTHIIIPAELTSDEAAAINSFEIKIVAEAIQAEGFNNVTDAFIAFDN